ncbi:MAG: hypothetical protein V1817_03105 [Candidatus Micrarchaeota archaeon]
MDTKLIRVDEEVFEELHSLAGKLQMRERRRVSVNAALRVLLFPKNEHKTNENAEEIHSQMNLNKGVSASKASKKTKKSGKKLAANEANVALYPMRRFSLKHKKFVSE